MNSRERRPQAGRNLKLASSLAAVILASSLPAPSATAADDQWAPLSSKTELRAGALVHDVPFTGPGIEYGGVDLNLEAVFPRLPIFQDTRFRSLVPRPQIGGTANFSGKTSYAYLGGVWTWKISRSWFFEPIAGVGFHNGKIDVPKYEDRLSLGCNPLFHIGASAGYRITDQWAVMASWVHLSNANLCKRNEGLNEIGVKVSRSF